MSNDIYTDYFDYSKCTNYLKYTDQYDQLATLLCEPRITPHHLYWHILSL